MLLTFAQVRSAQIPEASLALLKTVESTASYAVVWHTFWHRRENREVKQGRGVTHGVAVSVANRWVIFVPSHGLAVTMLAGPIETSLWPLLEVDESISYQRSVEEALTHYMATHAPDDDGCVGRIRIRDKNGSPLLTEPRAGVPLERPCIQRDQWMVGAKHDVRLSLNSSLFQPQESRAARDALGRIVRAWSRENFPGSSGMMTIPSVAVDVDPRIYVLLTMKQIQRILVLQRGDDGRLTGLRLIERRDSVAHYQKRIEVRMPFTESW
jgi:hypothetical protein